jgi:vitamin K-dependent gamma-carboxylase
VSIGLCVSRVVLEPDAIEYYMVHMGGLVYDLSVGFMLNFEISKKLGILVSVAFHGMNSQLFNIGKKTYSRPTNESVTISHSALSLIGMFPYVCLASLILFCKSDQFPISALPHCYFENESR